MTRSATATLLFHLKALGVKEPVLEYKFALPERRFRFDLCWPDDLLACELDGGTWSGGRHVRGAGYAQDCVKLNMAIERGWFVLRYVTEQVMDGSAAKQIARIFKKGPK